MTSQPQNLALVIPFFNGKTYLAPLLESIGKNSLVPHIVIVCDNGTDIISENYFDDHNYPFEVVLVSAPAKIGFGRACNLGVRVARKLGADFCVITNQDATFTPESIDELYETFHRNSAILVSPIQVSPITEELTETVARTYVPGSIREDGTPSPLSALPLNDIRVGEQISGACLGFEPHVFEKLGGFDPIYTMYGEDDDLARRFHVSSGEIWLSRRSIIRHYHSNDIALGLERVQILAWRNEAAVIDTLKSRPWTIRTPFRLVKLQARLIKGVIKTQTSYESVRICVNQQISTFRKIFTLLQTKSVHHRYASQTETDLKHSAITRIPPVV